MNKHTWRGAVAESKAEGLNLSNTRHAGKSAAELRRDDPALAAKWAAFIAVNRDALIREISSRIV